MRKLVAAVAVAIVSLPTLAFAGEKKPETTEHYVFTDPDKLVGGQGVPDGMRVGVHGVPVRTLLVRPRLQFVVEMLKSIEAI